MDDYILSHYISVSWKPGWRRCKVEGDWEWWWWEWGVQNVISLKVLQPAGLNGLRFAKGLGGRVRFRKPSSKCSLLWNRKCSFREGNRHNGDHITPARAHVLHIHTCQVLNLRLPGSEQKVRACAALLRAVGAVVLDKLMQWAESSRSAESVFLFIPHACLFIHFTGAITACPGKLSALNRSTILTPWYYSSGSFAQFTYVQLQKHFFTVLLQWSVLWLFAVVLVSKLKGSRMTRCDWNGCFLLHGCVLIFNNINVCSVCCLL